MCFCDVNCEELPTIQGNPLQAMIGGKKQYMGQLNCCIVTGVNSGTNDLVGIVDHNTMYCKPNLPSQMIVWKDIHIMWVELLGHCKFSIQQVQIYIKWRDNHGTFGSRSNCRVILIIVHFLTVCLVGW